MPYPREEAICRFVKGHVFSPIDNSRFIVYDSAYIVEGKRSQRESTQHMKKAAIFVLVSTDDQHAEAQLFVLLELASRRSFEVVKVYQDCGVSGRRARRP